MEYASWNFATLYLIGLVQSSPESSPGFPTSHHNLPYPIQTIKHKTPVHHTTYQFFDK